MSKRAARKDVVRIHPAAALFYLNAFLWFGYMIYIYYDMAVVNRNGLSADIATLFVFGNAALMAAGGVLLGRRKKWTYYFASAVALLNALLTLASHSDIVLVIMFLIDLIILWQLLSFRKSYLSGT